MEGTTAAFDPPGPLRDSRFADPFARKARSTSPDYPSAERGRIPGEAGIWIFIFGDLLIFGLFFVVFIVERSQDLALFEAAHAQMSLTFGTVNTLILLSGSMFVVLGVHALKLGKPATASRMILAALATGAAFTVSKVLEYADKLEHGHTPATNAFYMYYFVFTGIHLVHLLIGMLGLWIMHRITRLPRPSARDFNVLEAAGCFWHLVDLLWIVLFALLYLVR